MTAHEELQRMVDELRKLAEKSIAKALERGSVAFVPASSILDIIDQRLTTFRCGRPGCGVLSFNSEDVGSAYCPTCNGECFPDRV